MQKLFEAKSIIKRHIYFDHGSIPPQEKGVKKISVFFVKKTVLSELASSRFLEKNSDF